VHDNDRVVDVRVIGEDGLDPTELDAVSANLDLEVGATEELDTPIG